MFKTILAAAVLLGACYFTGTEAFAQVEKLPPYLQETLAEIGPVFQKDISKTIPATVEAFQPLLRSAPRDGVTMAARRNLHLPPRPKRWRTLD